MEDPGVILNMYSLVSVEQSTSIRDRQLASLLGTEK